jgi:predicted amidohydrolase
MTPYAIAGLQLELGAGTDNLPHIRARLGYLMAVFPWVQMVMISELATFGPSPARAEPLPGPTERTYQELAKKHGIWLINGSLMEMRNDRVYNTSSVIDPDGRVIARYRKLFPFLPYEQGVEAGSEFVVFDVPDAGRFGISICYDMWFPETSRTLAAMGAEVILHPVMTTTIDRETEVAMARATAAQNQCFVIDVNGAGEGGNGRSIIAGPAGEVLYQAGTAEELIPLEIDFDRVRRSRETGLRGLGHPLKSFRDARVDFTVYQPGSPARAWLDTLGPVEKPTRGSRVGLNPHRTWRNGDPSSELQQEMDLQKTALASELASTGKSASQS